eukprot:GHVR01017722.1.p1 GENE.GHVR01017722.1~~GHVR01017722.1.p1  ORF type:complete len:104 (-),score=0.62 GHVR01017722.1:85-396(-)
MNFTGFDEVSRRRWSSEFQVPWPKENLPTQNQISLEDESKTESVPIDEISSNGTIGTKPEEIVTKKEEPRWKGYNGPLRASETGKQLMNNCLISLFIEKEKHI